MHHFGGGYHDIKFHSNSNTWENELNVLMDENVWVIFVDK